MTNNNKDESSILTFLYYKLFVIKNILLNPDNFFIMFDAYVKKSSLNKDELQEIRSYQNKTDTELNKLLKENLISFTSGKISKLIEDPRIIKYSYQHQKNSFIENISRYLKQYGTKIPLHPEEDAELFGGNRTRITFVETLLALEEEGLLSVLRLEVGASLPHERTDLDFNYATAIYSPNNEPTSFITYNVPIATIQLTQKLIDLIEPNLAYIPPVLFFKGSQITVSEGLQDSLCRVLFRNKRSMMKDWSWDEVLDKQVGTEGTYDTTKDWRKVYDPGREINTKIAIETGIPDLLIIKKRTVRINPKYLPLQK